MVNLYDDFNFNHQLCWRKGNEETQMRVVYSFICRVCKDSFNVYSLKPGTRNSFCKDCLKENWKRYDLSRRIKNKKKGGAAYIKKDKKIAVIYHTI